MAATDLTKLASTRTQLADLAGKRNAVLTDLAATETALAELQRSGASDAKLQAASRRADKLRQSHDKLNERELTLNGTIADLRGRLRLDTPERSVEQLDGGVPVTMLPVRIETRFGEGNTTLRIRVFPDQVHVDTHEPELTAQELALALTYWQQRWAAGDDADAKAAAWTTLARATRPTRARWLVQATTPTNIDQLGQGEPVLPDVPQRPAAWTRAPLARLLPEQWVAIGYRGGSEVFRRWGLPIAETVAVGLAPDLDAVDDPTPPPAEQQELPVDDGMKWMLDYDAALAIGMAITVTDDDMNSGTLAAGLDELVVLGVDWSLKPEVAAAGLADQMARHAVSDGLALLSSGTPTNNTDEQRAAAGTDPRLDRAPLDPTETDAGVQAESERIGRALGLADAAAFAAIAGHGSFDDTPAADMSNVLWATTIGYFLDQLMRPLVPTPTADAIADHFRTHVRGRGPFGTLRVGRQPYGVLPVVAGDLHSDDPFEAGLAQHLGALRPFWTGATASVPQLGGSDRPDADLVDLLRRTPRSGSFRFREAAGTTTSSSLLGFDLAAIFQEQFAQMLLSLAGVNGSPELARITVSPTNRAVPVPLVTRGELSETATLDPDYISGVLGETNRVGGLRRLIADPGSATSLLEALLRQSASLEYTIAAARLVITHELLTNVLAVSPRIAAVPDRELFDLNVAGLHDDAGGDDQLSLLATVSGPVALATTQIAEISPDHDLADFVATRPDVDLFARPETARFAAFRTSLQRLATVPTAELGRLAADTLDCASHRLDAWITSVASRQLEGIRTAEVTGTHIGAFGYVEDLAPRSTPPSLGYLQAPSIAHATTAAVLRSGHLARRPDDEGLLALDLSSTRVALALELIEGVRRGQPIGTLLGYRFERGLPRPSHHPGPVHPAVPPGRAVGPDRGRPRRWHAPRGHRRARRRRRGAAAPAVEGRPRRALRQPLGAGEGRRPR